MNDQRHQIQFKRALVMVLSLKCSQRSNLEPPQQWRGWSRGQDPPPSPGGWSRLLSSSCWRPGSLGRMCRLELHKIDVRPLGTVHCSFGFKDLLPCCFCKTEIAIFLFFLFHSIGSVRVISGSMSHSHCSIAVFFSSMLNLRAPFTTIFHFEILIVYLK